MSKRTTIGHSIYTLETSYPTHPDDQWRLVEHQIRTVRSRRLAPANSGWRGRADRGAAGHFAGERIEPDGQLLTTAHGAGAHGGSERSDGLDRGTQWL